MKIDCLRTYHLLWERAKPLGSAHWSCMTRNVLWLVVKDTEIR